MCIQLNGTGAGAGGNPVTGMYTVFVNNLCPECEFGHLDFATPGDGSWDIEWCVGGGGREGVGCRSCMGGRQGHVFAAIMFFLTLGSFHTITTTGKPSPVTWATTTCASSSWYVYISLPLLSFLPSIHLPSPSFISTPLLQLTFCISPSPPPPSLSPSGLQRFLPESVHASFARPDQVPPLQDGGEMEAGQACAWFLLRVQGWGALLVSYGGGGDVGVWRGPEGQDHLLAGKKGGRDREEGGREGRRDEIASTIEPHPLILHIPLRPSHFPPPPAPH